MNTQTLIDWQPPIPVPDADLEVLVSLRIEGDIEVFEGYRDGEQWRAMDGMPITWPVVSWAHKPEGCDLTGAVTQ
jgi:hypothetical protein